MTTPTSSNLGSENSAPPGEESHSSFAPNSNQGSTQPVSGQPSSDPFVAPTYANGNYNPAGTSSGSAYAPPGFSAEGQSYPVQNAQNSQHVFHSQNVQTPPNVGQAPNLGVPNPGIGTPLGQPYGVNPSTMPGGFAPNPGQNGAFGGQPGVQPMNAPMGEVPQVATKPNGFVRACQNLFLVQGDLWRGQTSAAIERVKNDVQTASMPWALWVVPFVVTAVAFGLAVVGVYRLAIYLIMGMIGIDPNFMRMLGVDLELDWRTDLFICAALCGLCLFLLRTLGVWITHKALKAKVSFQEAANQFALGLNIIWPLLLLLFLLSYTSLGTVFSVVLLCLGTCILFSELTIYVGISRTGGHKCSPIAVHVWLSTIAIVLAGFAYSVLAALIL